MKSIILVLNDGETFSTIQSCAAYVISDATLDVLDTAGELTNKEIINRFNMASPNDLRALADYLERK